MKWVRLVETGLEVDGHVRGGGLAGRFSLGVEAIDRELAGTGPSSGGLARAGVHEVLHPADRTGSRPWELAACLALGAVRDDEQHAERDARRDVDVSEGEDSANAGDLPDFSDVLSTTETNDTCARASQMRARAGETRARVGENRIEIDRAEMRMEHVELGAGERDGDGGGDGGGGDGGGGDGGGGACGRRVVWIDPGREINPRALERMGLGMDRVWVLRPRSDRDLLWAMIECLRSGAVAAVVGPVPKLDATAARKLQLAAEAGSACAITLRTHQPGRSPHAAASRWFARPAAGTDTIRRWHLQLLHGHPHARQPHFIFEHHRIDMNNRLNHEKKPNKIHSLYIDTKYQITTIANTHAAIFQAHPLHSTDQLADRSHRKEIDRPVARFAGDPSPQRRLTRTG